eukprot:2917190-Pleurochrysis_carterae.AAC.3
MSNVRTFSPGQPVRADIQIMEFRRQLIPCKPKLDACACLWRTPLLCPIENTEPPRSPSVAQRIRKQMKLRARYGQKTVKPTARTLIYNAAIESKYRST